MDDGRTIFRKKAKGKPLALDDYMALPYEVQLFGRAGDFTLFLRDLSLAGRGPNPTTAHDDLQRQKAAYFQALLDAGRHRDIRLPRDMVFRRELIRTVVPFSAKAMIAALVFVVAVLALLPALKVQLHDLRTAARFAGQALPKGFVDGLADLKAMPADQRDRVVHAVRDFLNSIEPVIDEVRRTVDKPLPPDEQASRGQTNRAP